jgi:hypothetical protein
MTANELADKCNRLQGEIILGFLADCATMLRQQAQEIAMLKQIIDANNLQSDIGQLDTRSYLIGRYDGLEKDELKQLVKSFFEDYLDYQEESDSGRVFNPIHVSCTRVMMIESLAKLLMRMRELSGVKE